MKRVTGIGEVFFKAGSRRAMRQWYRCWTTTCTSFLHMSRLRTVLRAPWRRYAWTAVRLLGRAALPLAGLALAWRRRHRHTRSMDNADQEAGLQALGILRTTPCSICGRYVEPLEPHTIRIIREKRKLRSRFRRSVGARTHTAVRCADHM